MAYIDKTFTNITIGSTSSATNSAYITSIKYGLCDDAAVAVLGEDWRTPTREECNELCENTSQDRVTVGGIECLKFTSLISDAYIILPNTGYKNEAGEIYANGSGHYMTASIDSSSTSRRYSYNFNTLWYQPEAEYTTERHYGYAVRPVSTTKGTDLDLPSGLKWATMNVGASSPEEYGNYYAWGETAPKEVYTLDNYKYYNAEAGYTKYNRTDNKLRLDNTGNSITKVYQGTTLLFSKIAQTKTDDAARAILGGKWRIPTKAEWESLIGAATVTKSGTSALMTFSDGQTLTFPAGAYWTSIWANDKGFVWAYSGVKSDGSTLNNALQGNDRQNGNQIRAVISLSDASEEEKANGVIVGNVVWSKTNLVEPETGNKYTRWGDPDKWFATSSAAKEETYKWYDYTLKVYTKYTSQDGLKVLQLEYVDQ